MVCSRISAVAAFVGSLVGAGVAALVGEDAAAIENGMYGFNSSLILTAMVMFYVRIGGYWDSGECADRLHSARLRSFYHL